jgi:hypothetical protein
MYMATHRDEEITREMEGEAPRWSSHCTDIECLDRMDRMELATLLSAGLAHVRATVYRLPSLSEA